MALPKSHPNAENYGRISIVDLGTKLLRSPRSSDVKLSVEHRQYVWTPNNRILGDVSPDLAIRFDCYVDKERNRRFVPCDGFEVLIQFGFEAGLAILAEESNLSKEHRFSYRVMKIFFDIARSMKERYGRRLLTAKDLLVYKGSKRLETHILPVDLGLEADGKGRTWNVQSLIDHGRESAKANGVTSCNTATAIQHGLYEGARRKPLKLRRTQVTPILRRSLFVFDKTPARSLVAKVQDRFLNALERHLKDTKQQFRKWCYGPNNNLMKSLANQAQDGRRKLEIADVRTAMLELGWKSYSYISPCLHAFFRWFEKAVELNPREAKLYRMTYFPQKYFGNLPLVLLLERGDILGRVITDLWEGQDPQEAARIVYRLLYYYSHMMGVRRAADRTIKNPKSHQSADDLADSSSEWDVNDELDDIVKLLARDRKFKCDKAKCKLHGRVLKDTDKTATIKITCDCLTFNKTIVVLKDTLKKLASDNV